MVPIELEHWGRLAEGTISEVESPILCPRAIFCATDQRSPRATILLTCSAPDSVASLRQVSGEGPQAPRS